MIIYGLDGRTYPVYLRAEGVHSANIPDLFIKISGDLPDPEPTIRTNFIQKLEEDIRQEYEQKLALEKARMDAIRNTRSLMNEQQQAKKAHEDALKQEIIREAKEALADSPDDPLVELPDFIKTIEFDPSKLHGFNDYDLWGENWRDRQKPIAVYRDDHFTYIHFGENYKYLSYPVAYVVVDDKDQTVNTRVQGTTLVVESVKPLIRLVVGESYLCLLYTGDA